MILVADIGHKYWPVNVKMILENHPLFIEWDKGKSSKGVVPYYTQGRNDFHFFYENHLGHTS